MDYSILRENDIRGIYKENLTEEVAYNVGQAFGTYLRSENKLECVVGFDNRVSSPILTENLIKGLRNTGINVIFVGRVTTPILNFATIKFNIEAGIMVTASHNPASDNGFKLFGKDFLHLDNHELNKVYDLIKSKDFKSGNGSLTTKTIIDDYLTTMKTFINIKNRPIKAVIDTGNGTVSLFIKQIMGMFPNLSIIYLNDVSDGTFPVHNPDPNVDENLAELKKVVKENKCDIGIAYDGDGDRVGIVDELGNTIESDKLLALFGRNILVNNENKKLVFDVKCSKALVDDINAHALVPIMVKNGSAFIESEIVRQNALIGGEYSGHLFFRDRHFGYDDGVYVSLRLIEIMSNNDKKLSSYLDGYKKYFNTPEYRIKTTEELKWKIVDSIKDYVKSKNYNFIDIDGVRVEFEDGWALVRASNTSAQLSIRFEAITEERLKEIEEEFMTIVNNLNKI